MQLAELQLRKKRGFIFERPSTATRWAAPCVQAVMKRRNVFCACCDQCTSGLKSKTNQAPMQKPTCLMTDIP
eukprot:412397-Alexandrium_andersonii.AAC.1